MSVTGTHPRSFLKILLVSLAVTSFILTAACSGGTGTPPPPPPPGGNTTTQFRFADAPVDRVISFEVSLGTPLVLKPASGGANVNVTLAANRLEVVHSSGSAEPLVVADIPQGNYSGMTLTVTDPQVTFLNTSGAVQKIEATGSTAVDVTFGSALTVGTSPGVISIDLNAANSLTFDSIGNVSGFSFTGTSFTASVKPLGNGNQQEADEGEIEDVFGKVTAVSGSNFTITAGQSGLPLTFATDSSTVFSDGATLATMLDTLVNVDGFTKSDGTLYAKEVEGFDNDAELEGLIVGGSGNPATSLTLVVRNGAGTGMAGTKLGEMFIANVNGLQAGDYRIKQGNLDFSGLTVPGTDFPFGPTTVHAGQDVEIDTDTSIPAAGGTVAADKVSLRQQTLIGTVASVSGTTAPRQILINVPADSIFATTAAVLTVHVFEQPGTDNRLASIQVSDQIKIRGMVFFAPFGQVNVIARRITAP